MKNIKKITTILMVASISMVLFTGCSSKKSGTASTTADTASTTADTSSTKADTTSITTDTQKNAPTEMKTLYTTVLKALVTDKTITQTQSDKVLAVVTKEPTDGAKPTGTAPVDETKSTGTDKTNGTKPTGTAPIDATKPKNDRLAELVTSKVITQAQSDTINQKVQEAMQSTKAN